MYSYQVLFCPLWLVAMMLSVQTVLAAPLSYTQARWNPLHFQPAIESASDQECLNCHQEILANKPRQHSPAGLSAEAAGAWYQNLSTYTGVQETFHRRHLLTPLAKQLMRLNCNFCHRGHDPREAAPPLEKKGLDSFKLRQTVNTEKICLPCHGQENYALMGLLAPWPQAKMQFNNNCLNCHATIRTWRHQVNYLNADAIELAAAKNADVCYGCHGGRAWYQHAYSYTRHPWPGMPKAIPEWAQGRASSSEFDLGLEAPERPMSNSNDQITQPALSLPEQLNE